MTPEQFVHWMKGFIDGIERLKPISQDQTNVIRKKLTEVNFNHSNKQLLTEVYSHNPFTVNSTNTSTTYDSFENKNQTKLEL